MLIVDLPNVASNTSNYALWSGQEVYLCGAINQSFSKPKHAEPAEST